MKNCLRSAVFAAGLAGSNASAFDAPKGSWASAIDEQHPCRAEHAQSLVGRVADARTVARANRLSGSAIARVVRPGQPISMDYNTARLTIEIDEKKRIIRLYCS
jgi:hypothetical protein